MTLILFQIHYTDFLIQAYFDRNISWQVIIFEICFIWIIHDIIADTIASLLHLPISNSCITLYNFIIKFFFRYKNIETEWTNLQTCYQKDSLSYLHVWSNELREWFIGRWKSLIHFINLYPLIIFYDSFMISFVWM